VLAAANGPLGATLLDAMEQAGVTPVAVLVGPDRPGRPDPCPFVSAWAQRRDLPAIHVGSWRGLDSAAPLRGLQFDVLLSLAYDLILPDAVLALAGREAVNLHRGLAPDFRGCYSTAWALEHGAPVVGVTLHRMVADVDAGPILAHRSLPVAPELTAAELTPQVEELAVALLADTIHPLLAGELSPVEQHAGLSFPRRLPDHELAPDVVAPLANRVRALHFPPHPAVTLRLGDRRFQVVEADPAPLLVELAGAAYAHAFSSAAGAFAHGFSLGAGPLVLPDCGPPDLYAAANASGRSQRFYRLDDALLPDLASLRRAACPGALVVLPAPFGRECSAQAAAIAVDAGATVLEDRGDAVLSRPRPVDHLAVVALHPWLPVPDGALLLSADPVAAPAWTSPDFVLIGARLEASARCAEQPRGGWDAAAPGPVPDVTDVAPRTMSRFSQRRLLGPSPLPTLRAAADASAAQFMAELGTVCAFTHWPAGTHAHGFPVLVDDPEDALTRLGYAGVLARRPWVAAHQTGQGLADRLLLITGGMADQARAAIGEPQSRAVVAAGVAP
jgi:methionyl-tRNA formyltransferase